MRNISSALFLLTVTIAAALFSTPAQAATQKICRKLLDSKANLESPHAKSILNILSELPPVNGAYKDKLYEYLKSHSLTPIGWAQNVSQSLPTTTNRFYRGMILTKNELIHILQYGMSKDAVIPMFKGTIHAGRDIAVPILHSMAEPPFGAPKNVGVIFEFDANKITNVRANPKTTEVYITQDVPAEAFIKIYLLDVNKNMAEFPYTVIEIE